MKILFFASLREQLDCDGEQWQNLEGALTVADVKAHLQSRGEPWRSALANERIIVSINQEVAELNSPISLDDELAFYPPVTGG
jgi:molybdopterin synthase sulfur carrier subunit